MVAVVIMMVITVIMPAADIDTYANGNMVEQAAIVLAVFLAVIEHL